MPKKRTSFRKNVVNFEIESIHEASEPDHAPNVQWPEDVKLEVERHDLAEPEADSVRAKLWIWERRAEGLVSSLRRWLIGKWKR